MRCSAAGAILPCFLALTGLRAQVPGLPDTPKELRPPDKVILLRHLIGKGQQIYTCQNTAGTYAWKLKAPDAKLFDEKGREEGRHFAGPTWELRDGSRVVGSLVASVKSPDSKSISWLLLSAKSHEGNGAMATVAYIQRLGTTGGVAPQGGCSESSQNQEASVAYQAEYYFYAAANK